MRDLANNFSYAAASYRNAAKTCETDNLVLDNVGYVGRILSTMAVYVRSEEARENLQAAGILGLVEAANKYEPSKGTAFRTFAFPRIRGAIIDELRKLTPVSQRVLGQISLLRKAHENLEPPVTAEQLSKHTGLELEDVYQTLEAMRFIDPQDWNDLHSVVHGSWTTAPDDPAREAERNEMKELLAEGISQLPERERLVISLYYTEELNLAEIGAVIDLSESRVSRILAGARFKIGEFLRSRLETPEREVSENDD
ncbi:MAG: sigma-70 family RNA polymerase sigma factor [Planctomycetota bacterium]